MPIQLGQVPSYCTPDDIRKLRPTITPDVRSNEQLQIHCDAATSKINAELRLYYVDIATYGGFQAPVDPHIHTIAIWYATAYAIRSVMSERGGAGASAYADALEKRADVEIEKIKKREMSIAHYRRTDAPSTEGVAVYDSCEDKTPVFDRCDELGWKEPSTDMGELELEGESVSDT